MVRNGGVDAMRRGYLHLFWKQGTWKTEEEILNIHFHTKSVSSFDKLRNV